MRATTAAMSFLPDLVAGTFAGFGICAVGHPFDTVKVLLQTQPGRYSGMTDAFRQTIAARGPLGLYAGVASPLIGMGIFNAVQFTIFGAAKSYATDGGRAPSLNRIAAAAGFTGIFVAFIEGPQDLFKCQMQSQGAGAKAYAGTWDCVKTIVRERGARGALQGIEATVVRNVIGVTAYFYVYEAARLALAGKTRRVEQLSFLEVMFSGGLGGLGYWVSCYPVDIVKSAIQCDAINPADRKYKGARGAPRSGARVCARGADSCPLPRTPRRHARRRRKALGRGRRAALFRGPRARARALLPGKRRGLRRVRGDQERALLKARVARV
jgi:solute carrier family 25 carnitine/acylcarnitine transporter 20/29